MSARPDTLTAALHLAVASHFGEHRATDAEEVVIATSTVAAHHVAQVNDPVTRGTLMARAQWVLRRVVDELRTARRSSASEKSRGPG